MKLICSKIESAIQVVMENIQNMQPETSGRKGHGRKENKKYAKTAKSFRDALRLARGKLNDKYNLSDEVSAVSATQSPDQGTEARG